MKVIKIVLPYVAVIGACVLLFSCTKGFNDAIVPVNIPVEKLGRILVLNGKIEKDSTALVQISYSEAIDASFTTPRVYEEKAIVTLSSSEGVKEVLTYWKNGWYYGKTLRGKETKTYTLTAKVGDREYTSTSTMLPAPGFRDAWVKETKYINKIATKTGYAEEWRVLDPVNTRDRYLFEWWRNGLHDVQRDWSIDDDRVVNVEGSLRLFNPTTDPLSNEYTILRAARIDKGTYDYYNMYEKIVRGIVGVASQTPFNPVSSFGQGTIGNFRAVSFSSIAVATPPDITVSQKGNEVYLLFPINPHFKKYHLYWSTKPGVSTASSVIKDVKPVISGKTAAFTHTDLTPGLTYYYRIQVEDKEGTVSILSPEINTSGKSTGGK